MVLPPSDGAAAVVAPEREALAYPSALAVGRAQFQFERGVLLRRCVGLVVCVERTKLRGPAGSGSA